MIRKITLAAISMFLLTSLTACSKKDETPKSSVDSSEVENNTDENKEDTSSVSSSKGDLELTSYQMQSVVSSINNKLSQMYEIGTYGWVSADNITLSRDKEGNLVASTTINRTENKSQYSVPAEFTLVFNHSSNTYSVQEETVDNDNKETIDNNSSSTAQKPSSSQPPTDLNEQDSFEINVSSGFSITLDTSSGGHGMAYAKADDGTWTLICDAQNEEKTGDVSLPAGHYTIHLFAEDGTHWGWSYNAY